MKKTVYPFVSGVVGGTIAQFITDGISGTGKPLSLYEAFLRGVPTGAQLASFPMATTLLAKYNKRYAEMLKDPKKNQVPVYIVGGMGAAAIFTSIAYPAKVLLQRYKQGEKSGANINLKDATGFYFDRLGISIGFPWAMNTLQEATPIPRNSLLAWARGHTLVHCSNIAGRVVAWPIHKIRHGSSLNGMIKMYLSNAPNVMITGDCVAAVKPALRCLA